jgi:hypothetical protein
MTTYSPFLEVLHDEREPVGQLGRGTHYSVLRALIPCNNPESASKRGVHRMLREPMETVTFAVIWDEDHDTRVIGVIQQLLVDGLLAPVIMIGERKGCVTVVVDPSRFPLELNEQHYEDLLQASLEADKGDSWDVECAFGLEAAAKIQIIHSGYDRCLAYLKGIDACWPLGLAPWRRERSVDVLSKLGGI